MKHYLDVLRSVYDVNIKKDDRTGTGTIAKFGVLMRFDLNEGFPLLTTKKVHLKAIIHELLWFLAGDTNIKYLQDNGVRIWNEWADENGDLGPVYGEMWRSWPNPDGGVVDQVANAINELKKNPNSRRIIISGWNPSVLPDPNIPPCENPKNGKAALPPCHGLPIHFQVLNGKLNCLVYQRSADLFLGVPFNIASYALMTMMMAQVCELEIGEFILTLGDYHIYNNHMSQVKLQLSREPRKLPKIKINPDVKSLFDFKFEDFELEGYDPYPVIKGKVSV